MDETRRDDVSTRVSPLPAIGLYKTGRTLRALCPYRVRTAHVYGNGRSPDNRDAENDATRQTRYVVRNGERGPDIVETSRRPSRPSRNSLVPARWSRSREYLLHARKIDDCSRSVRFQLFARRFRRLDVTCSCCYAVVVHSKISERYAAFIKRFRGLRSDINRGTDLRVDGGRSSRPGSKPDR